MTDPASEFARGRRASTELRWSEAYETLDGLDQRGALPIGGLELLSTAAFMVGRVDEMTSALERAHHAHLDRGDLLPAIRTALWLGINLLSADKGAQGSGWLQRAGRLLEPLQEDRVEQGYLLVPVIFEHIAAQAYGQVVEVAIEAAAIGRRFGDADLVAFAVQAQGRALIRQGKPHEGLSLLDEVMVAVTADELSPMVAGLIYCSVIESCYEIREIRRAAEWTDALSAWCDAQSGLVAFTDQCLVHRAELLQLRGTWTDGLVEARRARERATRGLVAARAYYQQAEIHRLQGELDRAAADYRNVSINGGDPQPGLARLRLAQGNIDAAVASLARALAEAVEPVQRLAILPAYVDALVAAGEMTAARTASDELEVIAGQMDVDMHRAWSAYASGVVDLAVGRPEAAIARLRDAFRLWQALAVPHEVARSRTALAKALLFVGDEDTATLELEAARAAFAEMGATREVIEVDALLPAGSAAPHPLTPRELEVLRLVAGGDTNRSIAAQLVLSERTVERHVSNIFAKLGVSTRSAATAHAYRHRLV